VIEGCLFSDPIEMSDVLFSTRPLFVQIKTDYMYSRSCLHKQGLVNMLCSCWKPSAVVSANDSRSCDVSAVKLQSDRCITQSSRGLAE